MKDKIARSSKAKTVALLQPAVEGRTCLFMMKKEIKTTANRFVKSNQRFLNDSASFQIHLPSFYTQQNNRHEEKKLRYVRVP